MEPQKRRMPALVELPLLLGAAIVVTLVVKALFAQAFYIPSESMVPTLQVNDRLLVDKLVYRVRDPRRGEIIVFIAEEGEEKSFFERAKSILLEGFGFQRPGDVDFVKRIIGLPGETVEIIDGVVHITPAGGGDSFTLDEPYVAFHDQDDYGPFVVPEAHYFVMGDNRPASSDSRVRGAIPRNDFVGRARVRIWPLSRISRFPTPGYD